MQEKGEDPSSSELDFRTTVAETFQERLAVLEERDKYVRQHIIEQNAKEQLKGFCPDMCPEKERLLRELTCTFSVYESTVVGDERHVVPELLVKEYARSSADQDSPLSHELRPEPVLTMTMQHLVQNVMSKFEEAEDIREWYNFCWDRLRSIRKDIIQQQLCNKNVVTIIEQCARFHIWCYDATCKKQLFFDDKLNTENVVNCLQLLNHMYDDLALCNVFCENEPEFRIYMMLLQLNEKDLTWLYHKYYSNPRLRKPVEEVGKIYIAFTHTLYTEFFSLVRKTSYLNSCILRRYYNEFRVKTLRVIINSHCHKDKILRVPVQKMRSVLGFDTFEEVVIFLESCGFQIDADENVVMTRSQFIKPRGNVQHPINSMKHKVVSLTDIIGGNWAGDTYKGHVIHCSFSDVNILNQEAVNASDQREALRLYFRNYNYEQDNLLKNLKEGMSCKEDVIEEYVHSDSVDIDDEMRSSDSYITEEDEIKDLNQVYSPSSESSIEQEQNFVVEQELADYESTALKHHEDSIQMGRTIDNTMSASYKNFREQMNTFLGELQKMEQKTNEEHVRRTQERDMHVYRKLKKLVARNMKKKCAIKYGRIWKNKVKQIMHRRINTAHIEHVPVSEHIQLWGTRNVMPINIMKKYQNLKEVDKEIDSAMSCELKDISHIGVEIANGVYYSIKQCREDSDLLMWWKGYISLPVASSSDFLQKVGQLCKMSLDQEKLGEVKCASTSSGRKVFISLDVGFEDEGNIDHLSGLLVLVSEKWESLEQLMTRITRIISEKNSVSLVVLIIGSVSYKQKLAVVLEKFCSRKRLKDFRLIEWDSLHSVINSLKELCTLNVNTTLVKATSFQDLLESVITQCFRSMTFTSSNPNTYIGAYNFSLEKLSSVLQPDHCRQQTGIPEELICWLKVGSSPKIVNNLSCPDYVSTLIEKLRLPSFSKWPPKSVVTLLKVLKTYSNVVKMEPSMRMLHLEALNYRDNSVASVIEDAPWVDIVECWARSKANKIITEDTDVRNLLVCYNLQDIINLTKQCGRLEDVQVN